MDKFNLVQDIDVEILIDNIELIIYRFYIPLFIIFGLLLPINAPAEYWGESIVTSFFVIGFLRLAVLLNISWLINSATHIWSLKPQDKLKSIFDTYSLLFKLFVHRPQNHGTVVIDRQGIYVQ